MTKKLRQRGDDRRRIERRAAKAGVTMRHDDKDASKRHRRAEHLRKETR
jgi:hypothetical protein